MSVRTRIAPSPTGDPHVGTAYMGLVNMVVARQAGGQFLLRIDDTDRKRYRPGSEQAIFDSLRWLGIEWDEGPDKGGPCGPYRQSERTAIYQEHARLLLERGKAYRCFCSQQRLAEVREAQKARKETPRYDRHCRDLPRAESDRRAAAGEPHVVRLAVPLEGQTVIQDLLRGPIAFDHAGLQDQVLLKEDGFPTYHLASCVDDHLFRITHIIRAEEWISSGWIHQLIFAGLGWTLPVLCHMPLLRNADKSKISKRKNPTSLLHYREAGYLPEAMLNFLGLMGWSGPRDAEGKVREVFGVADMQAHFRLEQIVLGGPVFNVDKLRDLNKQHTRALPPAEYVRRVQAWLWDEKKLAAMCALAQPRAATLGDFLDEVDFFLRGELDHEHPEDKKKKPGEPRRPIEGLIPKGKTGEEAWFALSEAQEALERLPEWTAAALEPACKALAEALGWKNKDLFQLLRVAVTGKMNTPPLDASMEVLGRPRSLGRMGAALRALPEPSREAREARARARASAADQDGEPATS
jgi:glutamyl-tRNA synthetase